MFKRCVEGAQNKSAFNMKTCGMAIKNNIANIITQLQHKIIY